MAAAVVPSGGSLRSMMLRKIYVSALGSVNHPAAVREISRSTIDCDQAIAVAAMTTVLYSRQPWPIVESIAVDRLDLLVDVATREPPAVPHTCTTEPRMRRSH